MSGSLDLTHYPPEPTLADFNNTPVHGFGSMVVGSMIDNYVEHPNFEPMRRNPREGLGYNSNTENLEHLTFILAGNMAVAQSTWCVVVVVDRVIIMI